MRDPIDPTKRGYILDVQRLRKLLEGLPDTMEVYVSTSVDPDEATSIEMEHLQVRVKKFDGDNHVVFTYDGEAAASAAMLNFTSES